QSASAHLYWTCFRQSYTALPIDNTRQAGRNSAPQIDREPIPRSDHIVWSHRQVHRNRTQISQSIAEHLCAETLWSPIPRWCLNIQIVQRRNIGVRSRTMHRVGRRWKSSITRCPHEWIGAGIIREFRSIRSITVSSGYVLERIYGRRNQSLRVARAASVHCSKLELFGTHTAG